MIGFKDRSTFGILPVERVIQFFIYYSICQENSLLSV